MNETAIAAAGALIGLPLTAAGFLLQGRTDRRLQSRGALMAAAGSGVQLFAAVLNGNTAAASAFAAFTAVWLWFWWNSGGGDGMRRLLKNARSLLTPRLSAQPT